MEYKRFRLGELVKIKYGKGQKAVRSIDGTVPIYGTGGLLGYATEALYDKSSILIGRKGTINKVRYVDGPFWAVDTMFYTEIDIQKVLPLYLFYLMSQYNLELLNEGTTVPSLRAATLNNFELNIPNIENQKKVIALLAPLDQKITLNQQINYYLSLHSLQFCHHSSRE